MAKTKSTQPAPAKLKGKSIAFAGKFQHFNKYQQFDPLIKGLGGKLEKEVTAKLDYLVVGQSRGTSGAEKKARQLNLKGAAILVIDETQFLDLVAPSKEEGQAMLAGGSKGIKLWNEILKFKRYDYLTNMSRPIISMPDMSGVDLHGLNLAGADLVGVKFDGADLHGCDLTGAQIEICNANLSKAKFAKAYIYTLNGCNLHQADLTGIHDLQEAKGADFTEAIVRITGYCDPIKAPKAIFQRADLKYIRWWDANLQGGDFSNALLTDADLAQVDLTGSNLTGAQLAKTNLVAAKLVDCDLSDADLTGANLADADLTGATIDGTDFTGANLAGAKVKGLNLSRAKGISQDLPSETIGPNLKELQKVAKKSRALFTSAIIDGPQGPETIQIQMYGTYIQPIPGYFGPQGYLTNVSLSQILAGLGHQHIKSKLQVGSITAKATKGPLGKKELQQLAVAAWCEVFGIPIPSADSLEEMKQAQGSNLEQIRALLLKELRGGKKGVAAWNARSHNQRQTAGPFQQVDLSAALLTGIDLSQLDFSGSNFTGATLAKGSFFRTNLSDADFTRADLTETRFHPAKLAGAKLDQADLTKANLWGCDLRKISCQKTIFRQADLRSAKLHGLNLSSALLDEAELTGAQYDEHTKFAKDFVPAHKMIWAGLGVAPHLRKTTLTKKPAGSIDGDTFMKRLEEHTDQAKLSKALAMLKADRFRLFAEIKPDHLVGVVKSQTDSELVYSCKLAADGVYGCCTQNLNICGGLRGSLCKHLLVLIVGLTKSGALDPKIIDDWVMASHGQKAVLDKDAMSETFLRYKGAEAGEVDWRPTETIPEDYYAM